MFVTGMNQRETVRRLIREAERWEALCGQNAPMMRYALTTEDSLRDYPRSFEQDRRMRTRLSDLYKEQAFKSCTQMEILIGLTYLQKARLEAQASKDNWARDCLGVIDANISALIDCHNVLRRNLQGPHY